MLRPSALFLFVLTILQPLTAPAQDTLFPVGIAVRGRLEKVVANIISDCDGSARQESGFQEVSSQVIKTARTCGGSTLEINSTGGFPSQTPVAQTATSPIGGIELRFTQGTATTSSATFKVVSPDTAAANRGAGLFLVPSGYDTPGWTSTTSPTGGNCASLSARDVLSGERTLTQSGCTRASLVPQGYLSSGTGAPTRLILYTYISANLLDRASPALQIQWMGVYILEPDCGSAVASAGSAVQGYAKTVPAAGCEPPDLEITRIYAVQVVQNESGDIPLAPHKATIVRVMLKSVGSKARDLRPVTGILRVQGFGSRIPINGGLAVAAVAPNPADPNHSLNFILPNELVTTGRLELEAEVELVGQTEAATENNRKSGSFEVYDTGKTEVLVLSFPYCFRVDGKMECPSDGIDNAGTLTGHVLPLDPDRFTYFPTDAMFPRIEWKTRLESDADTSSFNAFRHIWQLAIRRSIGVRGRVESLAWMSSKAPLSGNYSLLRDACANAESDAACRSMNSNRAAAKTLNAYRTDGFFTGFNAAAGSIVSDTGMPLSDRGWIDTSDYTAQVDKIKDAVKEAAKINPISALEPNARVERPATTASDAVLVAGRLGPGLTGTLERALRFPGLIPVSQETGAWCVRLESRSTPAVATCFDASPDGDVGFGADLPWSDDAQRIVLYRRDTPTVEVAVLTATGSAPKVVFTAPSAGETWEGRRSLSWTASDPDSKVLSYSLMYSNDNAKTWRPLALFLDQTTFEFDTGQIAGGTQVWFRVVASDGLRNAYTDVGPVEVRQRPELTVNQTSVNLGNRSEGDTGQTSITVRNTGTGPLTVRPSLPPDSPFQVAGAGQPITIRQGGAGELVVRFQPNGSGASQASLTLDGGPSPLIIELKGSAFSQPVPNLILPASVNLGSVPVNTSQDVTVEIGNDGTADLTVQPVSNVTDTVFRAATANLTIPPRSTARLMVRVSPTTLGTARGTLTLRTNDPSRSSVSLELLLTGVVDPNAKPAITVSPATYDFGSVPVGQSRDRAIAVANNGGAPLTVTQISAPAGPFTVLPASLPWTLAPREQREFTVRFTPTNSAQQTAAVSIASNDPANRTLSVPVSGIGAIAGTPALDVPASLDFDPTTVGQSLDKTLTIRNTGNAALNLVQMTLAGPYRLIGVTLPLSQPIVIDTGTSRGFTVRFSPEAAGTQNGSLALSSNDPARSLVAVLLNGSGGTGGGSSTGTILSIDNGIFGNTAGYANGPATAYFVNRLTPASYPSTLRSVLIWFPRNELPVGTAVSIVTAPIASGATPSNPAFQRTSTTITTQGSFVEIAVPALTITSGDFLVGFSSPNPAGTFPAAYDTSPGRSRSFASSNGTAFAPFTDGNFLIRCRVDGTTGTGAGSAAIDLPAIVDFGSATVGQAIDKQVTVRSTGTASLVIQQITLAGPYQVVGLTLPLTAPITIDGARSFTLRFTPPAAGSQNGGLAFATNVSSLPVAVVALIGTGTGSSSAGVVDTLLAVDNGQPDTAVGFADGSPLAAFVNRLTPPAYPATLRSVQIYFPQGELPVGAAITILSSANSSGTGGATLPVLTYQRQSSTVGAPGTFVEYPVAPVTISSGDFVVGFAVNNPAGTYPLAMDTVSGSRGRSYATSDQVTYRLFADGNFAIRARADVGGATSGATGVIDVSPASIDFGAVNSGQTAQSRIVVRNAGGGRLTVSQINAAGSGFSVGAPGALAMTGFALEAREQREIPVYFTPPGPTPVTGAISIVSDDPSRRVAAVELKGTLAGTTQTCTFQIAATASAGASASTATAPVTASASTCVWSATSNATWLTVSAAPGPGSGLLQYSVQANTLTTPRTGIVTITGGATLTVTQAGATGATGGTCPSTTNIAVGRPSSMVPDNPNAPASLGNNGVIMEPNGYGFHTNVANNPYWQVDLTQLSTICEVRMYNRADESQARARTIRILLSDDGVNFRTVYTHDGTVWGAPGGLPPLSVINEVRNQRARFVRLQLNEPGTFLHLREVEVYGFAGTATTTASQH